VFGRITAPARLCWLRSRRQHRTPCGHSPPPTHLYPDTGKINLLPGPVPTARLAMGWWGGGGDRAGTQTLPHRCLLPCHATRHIYLFEGCRPCFSLPPQITPQTWSVTFQLQRSELLE